MYLNVSYLGMKPNCFHENCPCVFHPQPAVIWSLASLLRRNVRQSLFKLVSAGRHSQVSFLGMNLETPTVDLPNLLFPTLKNQRNLEDIYHSRTRSRLTWRNLKCARLTIFMRNAMWEDQILRSAENLCSKILKRRLIRRAMAKSISSVLWP